MQAELLLKRIMEDLIKRQLKGKDITMMSTNKII